MDEDTIELGATYPTTPTFCQGYGCRRETYNLGGFCTTCLNKIRRNALIVFAIHENEESNVTAH